MEAWKLGLKAIAVYRDGCKRTQPLSTQADERRRHARQRAPASAALARLTPRSSCQGGGAANPKGAPVAVRRKLPDERQSLTHKFSIAGHEGYIHVGLYEDGEPGEIFVRMAKEGSTISGLMDSFATAISLALQHGVPLQAPRRQVLAHALRAVGLHRQPGDPARLVDHGLPLPLAGRKFLASPPAEQLSLPVGEDAKPVADDGGGGGRRRRDQAERQRINLQGTWAQESDAPPCHECGTIMVRSGACYKCLNCAATSGCS